MKKNLRTIFAAAVFACSFSASSRAETTIELWSLLDRGPDNVRTQTLDHVLTSFEKKYPDIKVKVTVVDWQQISPMMLRAVQAGVGPDISMLFSPFLKMQVAAGTLQPLDRYLASWPAEVRDDLKIFPNAKDAQGHVYGLPWELRVTGIMYRKDVLDAAGLRVPRTLPELAETAKKVAKPGWVGIALGFSSAKPDAGMDWFIPTAVGMGAKILHADGKADFSSPEIKRLLQFLYETVHAGKILPVDVAVQGDDDVQRFAEGGRAAFMPKMTHRLEFIRGKSGLGEAYQMMVAPTFDAEKPAPAYVQGWNLVIPKTSKDPDAAWKLIEHWTSPEMQKYQGEIAGYVPVRLSVSSDPVFAKKEYMNWAIKYAAAGSLDFPWPENAERLYTTLATMVSEVISDRKTIDAATVDAEQSYNQMLR